MTRCGTKEKKIAAGKTGAQAPSGYAVREAAHLYTHWSDFCPVSKDRKVGLGTVGDGFFLILSKFLDWEAVFVTPMLLVRWTVISVKQIGNRKKKVLNKLGIEYTVLELSNEQDAKRHQPRD